jgi:3-oxoadipate enol-lactonase/4-carboxymuconolactone decarboxylase
VSVPAITGVQLAGSADLPLLVCGPSLGTSATPLWTAVAERLGDRFHVIGWDLPGHGRNTDRAEGFTMVELARGVLELVDRVLTERGEPGGSFGYAGESVGGAVGLQLLLDSPARISAAVLLCTGARIGEPSGWRERAELVRASGTPVMVAGSVERWFPAGFLERRPESATPLLHALQAADRFGYAAVCDALADFDVRDRLGEIDRPVLAVAGSEDSAAPVEGLRLIAEKVTHGRLVVLDRVAHMPPVEAPDVVAQLIGEHMLEHDPGTEDGRTVGDVRRGGLAVRREVLGDDHVERAILGTTDFTRDFQDLITQYAWGSIWTRPGLDRRSRSLITLTALVARGHHEELAMHVRAARTNGLTNDEIKELLLQTAIYCGVPDANTAFRIAQSVLAELDGEAPA